MTGLVIMRIPFFILSLLALRTFAQDTQLVQHAARTGYLFPEEAPPAYILSSGVSLRATPSSAAIVTAVLSPAERIMVEEDVPDTLTVNGVRSPWYRVTTANASGWLWGGHIAQFAFGSSADPDVKFVAGIDHMIPSDTGNTDYSYRLCAVRNGVELDHIVVRSFAGPFESVTNLGPCGLDGVDDIITVNVPCVGGCGCTTGEVVVFWTGRRFHHVADNMGSPDGAYSTNTHFIYPADMEGEADVVIREVSDYMDLPDSTTEEGEVLHQLERRVRRERLKWKGGELVPAGETTQRRYVVVVD